MLRDALDTGGVWSIARGLARNVADYKAQLAACDLHRRNDLDGRGTLSEEALAGFTRFFLRVCIDQVKFMEGLVAPDRLRTRILIWVEEEVRAGALPPRSGAVLEAVLYRGELPRGDVAAILGTMERQARRVTSALLERECIGVAARVHRFAWRSRQSSLALDARSLPGSDGVTGSVPSGDGVTVSRRA